jgi:hypothetical protein
MASLVPVEQRVITGFFDGLRVRFHISGQPAIF